MAYLKTLADNAHFYELLKKMPQIALPLFQLHDVLMRGDEPFTVAQRELMFAYVSGLNACSFCIRGHVAAARLWGIDENLMEKLIAGSDPDIIEDKLKPVFAYLKKLALEPHKIVQSDIDAMYDSGWDDEAIIHACALCSLVCATNRLVDGMGIKATGTETTLAKVKWKSYTDNLLTYWTKGSHSASG